MPKPESRNFSVRMPIDLIETLKRSAREHDRPFTHQSNMYVRRGLIDDGYKIVLDAELEGGTTEDPFGFG